MNRNKFTTVADARQRNPQQSKPRARPKVGSVAHGTMFGPWRYDAHAGTLDFVREGGRFPSRAESPGWWMPVDRALHKLQHEGDVPRKTWLTSQDTADYVRALHRLREAQA